MGLQEKKSKAHQCRAHIPCTCTHTVVRHSGGDYLINLHISRLMMLGEFTYSNECALSPHRDNFLLNRCGWNFHLQRDFVSSICSSVAVDYVEYCIPRRLYICVRAHSGFLVPFFFFFFNSKILSGEEALNVPE